jgi:capsular exopolysaccharide synthesis family protein
MLSWRAKNQGIIRKYEGGNGLVHSHRQILQELSSALSDTTSRTVSLASASAREGRSTLAINLALVAAKETDSPVMLIDADTENPSLHKPFSLTPGPGIAEVIRGEADLDAAIRPVPDVRNVDILTTGKDSLGATTMAESDEISKLIDELRKRYKWIFADTAPVLTTPGAAMFHRRVDGVVMAVRWSSTRAQLVSQATDKLEDADVRVLGAVLTQRHFVIPSYVYRRL